MKPILKKVIVLVFFITTSIYGFSQCCGDGVCDSLAGENLTTCPYDCGGGGFNCPNTIGTFFTSGSWPVSFSAAQTNGWCYTITSPSTVCFEYEVPGVGDTASISLSLSGCNTSTVNQSNLPPGGGCNSAGGGSPKATYDNSCNLISNTIRSGGAGCYTPGDIITICIDVTATDLNCGPFTICPVIHSAGPGGTSAGCAPFDITSSGALTDPCDSTSGVGLVTPACGDHFSYLWDDPLAQTDSMAIGLTPGTYNVVVNNDSLANCDTTITITIPNIDLPDTLNVEESICEGDSAFLQGGFQTTEGVYYDTTMNGNCTTIVVTTLLIEELGDCLPSSILIPNVFTPNADGPNDVFTVEGVNLASVKCDIYNRWGQHMYSWDAVAGFWDGKTTSGAEAPDGTYYYIIKAVGLDGVEYEKQGAFSLIR